MTFPTPVAMTVTERDVRCSRGVQYPPICSAAPFVISPDGCVQTRPIWRLFGRRTRPLMHESSALGPSACAIEHGDVAADYAMTIAAGSYPRS
jgi:hypothetical protein